MITNILKNTLINILILNIKFFLNIKYKLINNFNIFICKLNLNNRIILNYIKNIKFNNMFNFRNKLNFNKSKRNIMPDKKKTGKARLGSSSSNVLVKGMLCQGLRNIKLKKYKKIKIILKYLLFYKKDILSINTLEITKFLSNIAFNNVVVYDNIANNFKHNLVFINFIKNYKHLLKNENNINIMY